MSVISRASPTLPRPSFAPLASGINDRGDSLHCPLRAPVHQAVQEAALEELFAKKVQAIWTTLEFTLNPYKESKEVFVLGSVEEVTVRGPSTRVTVLSLFLAHLRVEPVPTGVDR